MKSEATVLGAGVAGLCVATELVARGVSVTLIDPHGAPGPHACSWWAGGMLAPDCESEAAEEPVVRLGRTAIRWWQAQDVDIVRKGTLVVSLSRDRRELRCFARRTSGHRTLDRDATRALEPAIGERFEQSLYFADEAFLEPRSALRRLHQRLLDHNARLITRLTPDSAPTFDCRGLAARDTLEDLRGVRGEMLLIRSADIDLAHVVRLLHPRIPLYVVPRGDGVYMLGATQIESDVQSGARVRSVLELLTAAYALHPAFGEAEILEIGSDRRPAFPDNIPHVRRRASTIHVNGLYRHGFLLAPSLARMAVAWWCDGTEPELNDENHGERH